jgi:hypothetical protein
LTKPKDNFICHLLVNMQATVSMKIAKDEMPKIFPCSSFVKLNILAFET